jgi:hypothetical protein
MPSKYWCIPDGKHPALYPWYHSYTGRIFSDLQASNTYSRNADAVKIRGMDDFSKKAPSEPMDEMNVSFSNTPASMETVSSILKNNFNRLAPNIWYKLRELSKHMTCGGEYSFFIPFGITALMIIFNVIYAHISPLIHADFFII